MKRSSESNSDYLSAFNLRILWPQINPFQFYLLYLLHIFISLLIHRVFVSHGFRIHRWFSLCSCLQWQYVDLGFDLDNAVNTEHWKWDM